MLDRNAQILIVDDMKLIRTAIKKFLKSLGYTNLLEAENGPEAVKMWRDNNVALIFMDVVMPIMTGIEALKKIRAMDDKVSVVMLTSVADEKTIDECRSHGILDYVLKPLKAENGPDILKEIVARVQPTPDLA